jgi:hypothetical protein
LWQPVAQWRAPAVIKTWGAQPFGLVLRMASAMGPCAIPNSDMGLGIDGFQRVRGLWAGSFAAAEWSAFAPKADLQAPAKIVRFVPISEVVARMRCYLAALSPEMIAALKGGMEDGQKEIDAVRVVTTSSADILGDRALINGDWVKRAVGAQMRI